MRRTARELSATDRRAALLEARTAIAAVLEVDPGRLDVVC
jgi:hypothetical protein